MPGCETDPPPPFPYYSEPRQTCIDLATVAVVTSKNYATEHVVIMVVDGPRYSETWGDPEKELIPHMANDLAPQGIVGTAMYNEGVTRTINGHVALATGCNQDINNSGKDFPARPSLMQIYRKMTGAPATDTWVVGSKDKIEVLANTSHREWKDQFLPSSWCGTNGGGNGSGYGSDAETVVELKKILTQHHPHLTIVNLMDPDVFGHRNDWPQYINGIRTTDDQVWEIWKHIQTDPEMGGKTTLFVTNDHGRHLDDVADGFISHGDYCDGCRHINFFAVGPDFRTDLVTDTRFEQVNISATAAELLRIPNPANENLVMWELFR
ncbi:MAG: sulfatase [Salibacteraceae bacterium]